MNTTFENLVELRRPCNRAQRFQLLTPRQCLDGKLGPQCGGARTHRGRCDQAGGPVGASIASPLAGQVLFEATGHIRGDPRVERTVAAFDQIEVPKLDFVARPAGYRSSPRPPAEKAERPAGATLPLNARQTGIPGPFGESFFLAL